MHVNISLNSDTSLLRYSEVRVGVSTSQEITGVTSQMFNFKWRYHKNRCSIGVKYYVPYRGVNRHHIHK